MGVLALIAYAARASGGRPPEDALYEWSTVAGGVLNYAIVMIPVLLIARGGPARELFALRRPRSWGRATLLMLGLFVLVLIATAALDPFLEAGEEQGLAPDEWDGARARAFAANAVLVVCLAPVVEELTYRGLGYSLLRPYGLASALVGVGVAFGLAHGLVEALPILSLFGIVLAYLRERTDSVYPPMLLHAAFNGLALTVSVTI